MGLDEPRRAEFTRLGGSPLHVVTREMTDAELLEIIAAKISEPARIGVERAGQGGGQGAGSAEER